MIGRPVAAFRHPKRKPSVLFELSRHSQIDLASDRGAVRPDDRGPLARIEAQHFLITIENGAIARVEPRWHKTVGLGAGAGDPMEGVTAALVADDLRRHCGGLVSEDRGAEDICGNCVPHAYTPRLNFWIDRTQDTSHRIHLRSRSLKCQRSRDREMIDSRNRPRFDT